VFPDRVSAEHAIIDLRDAGFNPSRMGFVMRDRGEANEAAHDAGVDVTTGAVTAGVLGGALGAILAATGTFLLPGVGPFLAAGILASAIAGGAAGAIVGGLVGLGVPKVEAAYYEHRVQQGSVLVTVDAEGRMDEARQLLLRNGAEDTWRTSPWNQPRSSWETPAALQSPPTAGGGFDTTQQVYHGRNLSRTAPIIPPNPALGEREIEERPDRGSVVGPGDTIQHGPVTDPYGGRPAPSQGPLNYDEPALDQPPSAKDTPGMPGADQIPPGRSG
jgi:hypothetical protein